MNSKTYDVRLFRMVALVLLWFSSLSQNRKGIVAAVASISKYRKRKERFAVKN